MFSLYKLNKVSAAYTNKGALERRPSLLITVPYKRSTTAFWRGAVIVLTVTPAVTDLLKGPLPPVAELQPSLYPYPSPPCGTVVGSISASQVQCKTKTTKQKNNETLRVTSWGVHGFGGTYVGT